MSHEDQHRPEQINSLNALYLTFHTNLCIPAPVLFVSHQLYAGSAPTSASLYSVLGSGFPIVPVSLTGKTVPAPGNGAIYYFIET